MYPSKKFLDSLEQMFEKFEPYVLPMGGIREDAPLEIKKIYDECAKACKKEKYLACGIPYNDED